MNTAYLAGSQLDYWVAKTQGMKIDEIRQEDCIAGTTPYRYVYSPSTNWEQGGPLIEKYDINLSKCQINGRWHATTTKSIEVETEYGKGYVYENSPIYRADNLLEAAMRCIVASFYGDEVRNE